MVNKLKHWVKQIWTALFGRQTIKVNRDGIGAPYVRATACGVVETEN